MFRPYDGSGSGLLYVLILATWVEAIVSGARTTRGTITQPVAILEKPILPHSVRQLKRYNKRIDNSGKKFCA